MALDKKQIALTVGGILAGLTLTYLLYRLEQNNAANSAAAQANAESEQASQQAEIASLPSISVPTISSTPSTTPSSTDTTNQSQSSALDPNLESLITSLLGDDNSSVVSASNPVGNVGTLQPLPPVSGTNIQPNIVNPAMPIASPISTTNSSTFSSIQSTNSNGATYNTNLRGGSLASS